MPSRGIYRNPTPVGYATPKNAPIYVDADDNRVKVIPTGSGTTEVILQEAGGASKYERLTAARVLTAADSGKTFALALAGGFTVTLPALAAGMNFRFVVEVAPTTEYIILSPEGDNLAGLVFASDGEVGDVEAAFTGDQINFVANKALPGDNAYVESIGAGWFSNVFVGDNDGATITG